MLFFAQAKKIGVETSRILCCEEAVRKGREIYDAVIHKNTVF